MIFDQEHLSNLEDILSYVKMAGATEAVVAGGAVRDMLLGKPIKDIDVFYEGELENVEKYFSVSNKEEDTSYEGNTFTVTHKEVKYVYCEYPIQLIQCNDISDTLDQFPCNMSRVSYDHEGTVALAEDFIKGLSTKKLVFNDNCHSYEYVKRLSEKYNDWEIVNEQLDPTGELSF